MSCRPWILPKACSRETSTWCSTPKCREEDISLAGNNRNIWWETCASFSENCEPERTPLSRLRERMGHPPTHQTSRRLLGCTADNVQVILKSWVPHPCAICKGAVFFGSDSGWF